MKRRLQEGYGRYWLATLSSYSIYISYQYFIPPIQKKKLRENASESMINNAPINPITRPRHKTRLLTRKKQKHLRNLRRLAHSPCTKPSMLANRTEPCTCMYTPPSLPPRQLARIQPNARN